MCGLTDMRPTGSPAVTLLNMKPSGPLKKPAQGVTGPAPRAGAALPPGRPAEDAPPLRHAAAELSAIGMGVEDGPSDPAKLSAARAMLWDKTHPDHAALMDAGHYDHRRVADRYAALFQEAYAPRPKPKGGQIPAPVAAAPAAVPSGLRSLLQPGTGAARAGDGLLRQVADRSGETAEKVGGKASSPRIGAGDAKPQGADKLGKQAAESQAAAPILVSPTVLGVVREEDNFGRGAFNAPRGDRAHEGLDILAVPGEEIYAITSGTVSKIGWPYDDSDELRYVEITTDSGYVARIMYVSPADGLDVGSKVVAGETIIGQAQDVAAYYEKGTAAGASMKNHVHIELRNSETPGRAEHSRDEYRGYTVIDPTGLLVGMAGQKSRFEGKEKF